MKLTKLERIMLINQFEILKTINKDDKEHYKKIIKTLEIGATSQYHCFMGEMDDEISEDIQTFVCDVLDMYCHLETSYGNLSTSDQAKINKSDILYKGYDKKYDFKHAVFSQHILEDMGLYKDIYISYMKISNPCGISKERYAQMLTQLNDVINKRGVSSLNMYKFTVKEILEIVAS